MPVRTTTETVTVGDNGGKFSSATGSGITFVVNGTNYPIHAAGVLYADPGDVVTTTSGNYTYTEVALG